MNISNFLHNCTIFICCLVLFSILFFLLVKLIKIYVAADESFKQNEIKTDATSTIESKVEETIKPSGIEKPSVHVRFQFNIVNEEVD